MMCSCHSYLFTVCFCISKLSKENEFYSWFVFKNWKSTKPHPHYCECVIHSSPSCLRKKMRVLCSYVLCTSSNLLLLVLNNLVFRELLVSVRFDGPGWQWSGSFFPDHLGDAQLKMRNSASGVSYMVRVEVQNADLDVHSKKFSGRNNINTGTVLILLSDDKTGFVPYRIDNFSMEVTSLWVCAALASFENWMTIILMITLYRNCGYISRDVNLLKQLFILTHHVNTLGMSLAILIALLLRCIALASFFLSIWLILNKLCNIIFPSYYVQIPGERSLGTFNLDILSDDVHVSLPSTSEVKMSSDLISMSLHGL